MTYEQALQIAIEELYDSVEYLKAMNKGFPRVEAQCNELMEAHNLLRNKLEDSRKKFAFKNRPINFMPLEATPENFERSHQKEREWVGLSYRDVMGILEHWDFNRDSSLVEFNKLELCELFEVVEAKLKEKNT